MKKKKLYAFVLLATIILFLVFFSKYKKGVEVGTWGMNRSITWAWNFGF